MGSEMCIRDSVAIEQVTFPLLSKAAGLPAKFSEAFDGIMKFNYFFFFILPLIFIAPWILSFFPESYQLETSLFKWLVLLALAIIIHNPVDIVSYSLGRSKDYYNWVWKYGILQIIVMIFAVQLGIITFCLLYTSPSPRDLSTSRMPSSA